MTAFGWRTRAVPRRIRRWMQRSMQLTFVPQVDAEMGASVILRMEHVSPRHSSPSVGPVKIRRPAPKDGAMWIERDVCPAGFVRSIVSAMRTASKGAVWPSREAAFASPPAPKTVGRAGTAERPPTDAGAYAK